jgi:4'-phosphopantetheinyl transferase
MASAWDEILGSAHAWFIDGEKVSEKSLPVHWLDAEERALVQQFSGKTPRHHYLVARTPCRAVLSRYTGVAPEDRRFAVGKYGKPRIAAARGFSSLRFDLTHTTGLIVCLVSRAEKAIPIVWKYARELLRA